MKKVVSDSNKTNEDKNNISPCSCDTQSCSYHLGEANGYIMGLVKKKSNSNPECLKVLQAYHDKFITSQNLSHDDAYKQGYEKGWSKIFNEDHNINLAEYKIAEIHKFLLADMEFGETYHVGGASFFSSDQSQVDVSYTNEKQMLFLLTLLKEKQIKLDEKQRKTYVKLEDYEKANRKSNINEGFAKATKVIEKVFENNGKRNAENFTSSSTQNSHLSDFFSNDSGKGESVIDRKPEELFLEAFLYHLKESVSHLEERFTRYLQNKLQGMKLNKEKIIIAVRRVVSPTDNINNNSNMPPAKTSEIADEIKIKGTSKENRQGFFSATSKKEKRKLAESTDDLKQSNKKARNDNSNSNDKALKEEYTDKSTDNKVRASTMERTDINRAEWRNLSPAMLHQVIKKAEESGITEIILTGDLDASKIKDKQEIENLKKAFNKINICYMCNFYDQEEFKNIVGINSIAGQIYFYHMLHKKFDVKCIVGMMSGALDGPAFIGIPTLFFTDGGSRMMDASEKISSLKPIRYVENEIKDQFNKNADKTSFSKEVLKDLSEKIKAILHPQNEKEAPAPESQIKQMGKQ